MAQFLSLLLALFVASASFASPLETRSTTSIKCDLDRAKFVVSVIETEIAVSKIDTSDPKTASAVSAANKGLTQVSDGVDAIADAIAKGQAPPDSGRDEVEAGLNATSSALAGIDSSSSSTRYAVAAALRRVRATIGEGDAVLRDCS
ncbi:hypothetical protein FB45DRAFT_1090691 [Roridomyces roridus]|uniref:Cell wall protein n=1 Tax=Roridomyces roridus TaxID=1738132 RepID=A0AAD7BIB4_9AGAR|nr:hypothetical protein FB45DRAFT_1090691 [Roridomyces roridus]